MHSSQSSRSRAPLDARQAPSQTPSPRSHPAMGLPQRMSKNPPPSTQVPKVARGPTSRPLEHGKMVAHPTSGPNRGRQGFGASVNNVGPLGDSATTTGKHGPAPLPQKQLATTSARRVVHSSQAPNRARPVRAQPEIPLSSQPLGPDQRQSRGVIRFPSSGPGQFQVPATQGPPSGVQRAAKMHSQPSKRALQAASLEKQAGDAEGYAMHEDGGVDEFDREGSVEEPGLGPSGSQEGLSFQVTEVYHPVAMSHDGIQPTEDVHQAHHQNERLHENDVRPRSHRQAPDDSSIPRPREDARAQGHHQPQARRQGAPQHQGPPHQAPNILRQANSTVKSEVYHGQAVSSAGNAHGRSLGLHPANIKQVRANFKPQPGSVERGSDEQFLNGDPPTQHVQLDSVNNMPFHPSKLRHASGPASFASGYAQNHNFEGYDEEREEMLDEEGLRFAEQPDEWNEGYGGQDGYDEEYQEPEALLQRSDEAVSAYTDGQGSSQSLQKITEEHITPEPETEPEPEPEPFSFSLAFPNVEAFMNKIDLDKIQSQVIQELLGNEKKGWSLVSEFNTCYQDQSARIGQRFEVYQRELEKIKLEKDKTFKAKKRTTADYAATVDQADNDLKQMMPGTAAFKKRKTRKA